MIIYCLLGITLLFAFFTLFLVGRRATGIGQNQSRLALAITGGIFLYLYGAWVLLSLYLKYAYAIVFIFFLITAITGSKPVETVQLKQRYRPFSWLFSLILLVLSIMYFTGSVGKNYGVANLSFPLKHGDYIVFQGGRGLPTNLFHYRRKGMVYAMDLVKLNRAGNRANKIFSSNLGDYAIFGDTVFSPCAGRVLKTAQNNPDNTPPNRKRGPTNTNQVLIATNDYYVFMCHMKMNEVFVKVGQPVTTGQPLGLVGNSGFSIEPHLHIQVQQNTHNGAPWYTEPPMHIEFDGKEYMLFERITSNQ